MQSNRGFTLIELVLTLAIVSILAAIAVPASLKMIADNRLMFQANDVVAMLHFARSEAIKRATKITICKRNANAKSCGGDWSNGWIIYKGEYIANPNPEDILLEYDKLSGNNTVIPSYANFLTFNSTGKTSDGNFILCNNNKPKRITRQIKKITIYKGRIRTNKCEDLVSSDYAIKCVCIE